MKSTLKKLSEIVAQANDQLYARHSTIDTIMGIMDETLRKQGIEADAITVDCVPVNKKIVFLLHDQKPDYVDIALGNKAGEIYSSSEYDLETLSILMVVEIMEQHFLQ